MLQAFAVEPACDTPVAPALPLPIPPAVDVFVWFAVVPVTVPVTPNPVPEPANDVAVAEPLSVAVKIPPPGPTLACVEPPELEVDELLVPPAFPPANAVTETKASNAAMSLLFISFSQRVVSTTEKVGFLPLPRVRSQL